MYFKSKKLLNWLCSGDDIMSEFSFFLIFLNIVEYFHVIGIFYKNKTKQIVLPLL